MSLSPDINQLHSLLGEYFLKCIIEVTVFVFLYGLFVLLFAASVVLIVRRGPRGITQKLVFGATVLIFLLATLNVVNSVASFVVFVRQSLIDNDVPFKDRPAIVSRGYVPFATISVWAKFLPIVFGDGIVIWRAWILLPERRWILTLPSLLWIGTLAGTTLAYAGSVTTPNGYESFTEGGSVDTIIQAGLALSVFTNVSATLLIGWKLWYEIPRAYACKAMVNKMRISANLSHIAGIWPYEDGYESIFRSVYAQVNISYDGGQLPSPNWNELDAEVQAGQAMYPTLVFVLMQLQLSIPDVVRFHTVSPRLPIPRTSNSQRQDDAIPHRLSSQIYFQPTS